MARKSGRRRSRNKRSRNKRSRNKRSRNKRSRRKRSQSGGDLSKVLRPYVNKVVTSARKTIKSLKKNPITKSVKKQVKKS